MSYELDIEGRRKSSVHVQLLKQYVRRRNDLLVKQVTTVLEPDMVEDQIDSTYSEVKILETTENEARERDIAGVMKEFESTLTKTPGYRDLVSFDIDTGRTNQSN